MNNENEFISWDGAFEAEENQFITLPEGTYPFEVTGMERKVYDGNSDKIPNGAPYAEVSVKLTAPDGQSSTVRERLYLLKKFQWKLTQFFKSIGEQVVVGQPFKPNWNAVVGGKGQATVTVNHYTKDGEERTNNRIKEYLEPSKNSGVINPVPQSPQPQPQQSPIQNNGYQPGTGAF